MKYFIIILLPVVLLFGCVSTPKNFSHRYQKEYTGLDTLINIDGYYVAQHGCDTAFYTMFMFYPDGLFTIATTSKILPELVDCFQNGGKSAICQYPQWGIYEITGDTLKAQAIRIEGGGCTVFYNYKITADRQLINIADYVEPRHTMLGYMKNYPSFADNPCPAVAKFYPIPNRRSSDECPFIKKGWFWQKRRSDY